MSRQCFEVVWVRGQDGASGLRVRYDERVYGGTASGTSPEQCGASGCLLGQGFRDVTSFEELVLGGVSTGVAFQTFHQDN